MEQREDIALFTRNCFQGRGPSCADACPLHLDVRGFIGKLQKGKFSSALKILQKDLGFPALAAELCSHPCLEHCVLGQAGSSVSLPLLERAVLLNTPAKAEAKYRLPGKGKTAAVIGGGVCGLYCAHALLLKQYSVIMLEARDRLGGRNAEAFDLPAVREEITRQFEGKDIEIHLGTRVDSLDDIKADAFFIATGEDGEDFGLLASWDAATCSTGRPGVFLGGGLTGKHGLDGAQQGRRAADQIDRVLLGGKPVPDPAPSICRFIPYHGTPGGCLIGEDSLEKQAAVEEAGRCLMCDCSACASDCLMLREYRIAPPSFADEIINDSKIVSHGAASRNATRKVASCNLCGLCAKTCPNGVDIGAMVHAARSGRVAQGTYPAAFHEFWLSQMRFSLDEASLIRSPANAPECRYVFFPGCQLGASDPEYVLRAYGFLLDTLHGDAGMMLSCCGAPAYWAGEDAQHAEIILRMREHWQAMGSPTVIFACATCARQWKQFLPEAAGLSLYEIMAGAAGSLPGRIREDDGKDRAMAIFDPCASRGFPAMRQHVRHLASSLGIELTELPKNGESAQCCGWGGHIQASNPALFDKVVRDRTESSGLPYAVYCANCRDVFRFRGKECAHILGLAFGLDEGRPAPSIRQKKENSLALKARLLRQFWNEDVPLPSKEHSMDIIISPELRGKLEHQLISEEVIERGIRMAEESNAKMLDRNTGEYVCSCSEGSVTCWIRYAPAGDGFELKNFYCHRMHIEND